MARKTPTKKQRESLIRKELRENKVCRRGPVYVDKIGTDNHMLVTPHIDWSLVDGEFQTTKLDRVIQMLLDAEDIAILGIGNQANCHNCWNVTMNRCNETGPTPCHRWSAQMYSAKRKAQQAQQAKEAV